MAMIKSKAVRTYFLELSQQEAEELHQNLTAQGAENLGGYPAELQEALDKQLNRAKPGRKSVEESEAGVASETEEQVKTGPNGDGTATIKVQRDKNGNEVGVKAVANPADAAANAAAQAAAATSKKVSVPVG